MRIDLAFRKVMYTPRAILYIKRLSAMLYQTRGAPYQYNGDFLPIVENSNSTTLTITSTLIYGTR